MSRWPASQADVQQIVDYASQHLACEDCAASAGTPCVQPGLGRTIHKVRYVSAAIELRQRARAARRTPEQEATLASLPKVPRAEIEACRTPKGGYSFTRSWFFEHGLPYPPIPGWRQAVEQEEG